MPTLNQLLAERVYPAFERGEAPLGGGGVSRSDAEGSVVGGGAETFLAHIAGQFRSPCDHFSLVFHALSTGRACECYSKRPMATKLKTGDVAPDFELLDQKGERRRLSDFRGRWVVLYFYPKDNTPGCTKEACGFRDLFPKFQRRKIAIIGISTDSVRSHEKFAEKYDLPFILLADEEKAVVRAYGAWGQKSFMGRTTMGTHRISFLVDPEGRIAKIYDRVKPETHAEEVLRDLEELRKTG